MNFKEWKKDIEAHATAFAKRWNEIHPNNKISFVDEMLKQVESASAEPKIDSLSETGNYLINAVRSSYLQVEAPKFISPER